MDRTDIKQTAIWQLYEKGRAFHRLNNIYTDTDRNHRFYNGNQWEGAKLGGVEPVQKNFIKPIVKYKLGVVHDNLYALVFSSQNFDQTMFRQMADKYCKILNRYAEKVWEQDRMDYKFRKITKDACINDEGVLYIDFDKETMLPVNEIIDKNDIYYGNENSDDIQSQPYILIRKRMPVANARDMAEQWGVSDEDMLQIMGDNETSEQAGEDAKQEVDDQVTVVYKLYRMKGKVYFSVATRYCDMVADVDMGLKQYPVAHFIWEERKGSARGEGEVRRLIPNQIEVNRTEMRRILTVQQQAYPLKVADRKRIKNHEAVNQIGGVVWTEDMTVDDVRKVLGTIPPAQMSPDVVQLQQDLIQTSRELAGAGDIATGSVNPEDASGKAILAVQQAASAPMTEQREGFKAFVEDVARIWLEYLIIHSAEGVQMEDVITDPTTGEERVQMVTVPQSALEALRAQVRVDVTPKGAYDRFAQERTIENLLMNGFFKPEALSQLEIYWKVLPDDAVAPKKMIGEAITYMKEEQKKIAQLQAQANALQQQMSMAMADMPMPQMDPMQMPAAMAQSQQMAV